MDQTVTIHPKRDAPANPSTALPQLVRTPAGLALLELQGAFNLPQDRDDEGQLLSPSQTIHIGRIEFPDYDVEDPSNNKKNSDWMRRIQFYVGPNQRLTGEVKKLPRAIAVVRRQADSETGLEVVEIIHYKLLFSNRPEPMTESGEV